MTEYIHFLKTTNEQRTGKEFSHVHYIKAENIQHYKERKKKPVKDKPINQSSKKEQAFSNLNVNGSNSLLKDTKMNILVKKNIQVSAGSKKLTEPGKIAIN